MGIKLFGLDYSESVVSSTYLWRGQPVERSSISTRKASGPNPEPWGIAPLRFLNVNTELLTRTRCWRFVKWEANHSSKKIGMLYFDNLVKSML